MDAKDELLSIAEIAVALIGFSGLISAFRTREAEELAARDLTALAMIIGSGSLALVFSLVPIPLPHLGLSQAATWRLSSALFGGALILAVLVLGWINHRLNAAGHPERTPVLNRVTQGIGIIAASLLIAGASGAIAYGSGVYLLVLVVLLALCITFVVFLLVMSRPARGDVDPGRESGS